MRALSLRLSIAIASLLTCTSAFADGSVQAGRIYRLYQQAINRGDVAAATAYLTGDVRYAAGLDCPAARPCLGVEAARTGYIEAAVAKKIQISPAAEDMAPHRGVYRTRVEITWPGIERVGGAGRIVGVAAYTVRLDRIDSLVFTPDTEDSQTGGYFEADKVRATAPGAG